MIVSCLLVACTAAFTAGDALAVEIKLPGDMRSYGPGPNADLARGYCATCHAADYVYMQPPMSKEKWIATVNKMKKVFGCEAPDEDVDKIAEYLVSQNGPK
jgi:mono/diheme cytochrome c family protein